MRRFNALDLGPLATIPAKGENIVAWSIPGSSLADLFRNGAYLEFKVRKEMMVYRVCTGEETNPLGRCWTLEKPKGHLQAILDLALDPAQVSSDAWCVTMKIPEGTTVYFGYVEKVKAQGCELYGGGTLIVLLEPNPDWIVD